MTRFLVCMFFVVTAGSAATEPGGKVRCVGGTLAAFKSGLKGTVRTADQDAFVFVTPTSTLRIPYAKIDTIDYYDWLFQSFGLKYRFLGHSEGELRPLGHRGHHLALGPQKADELAELLLGQYLWEHVLYGSFLRYRALGTFNPASVAA